jgi:hypothetical protein
LLSINHPHAHTASISRMEKAKMTRIADKWLMTSDIDAKLLSQYRLSYLTSRLLLFPCRISLSTNSKVIRLSLSVRVIVPCSRKKEEGETINKMTTPRWSNKAYMRAVLAFLLTIILIVAIVFCLSYFGVFSSSSISSQDKVRQEASKTNSLKSLVASFLKGESHEMFIYEKIYLNVVMKLMSYRLLSPSRVSV